MSRRRSRAYNADSKSPSRLAPGFRGRVAFLDFRPAVALDVDCDGRGGGGCARLMRYEILKPGDQITYIEPKRKGVHVCVDVGWTEMTFTCRCGRPSVINLDAVRALLEAAVVPDEKKVLRVLASRLTRPPL